MLDGVVLMSNVYDKIQSGELDLDQALYPGKQLKDFNPEDLTVKVIPSGFPSFDANLVLKENRGELILIGARPSHGKSAMLFQMASNISKNGKAHIFSLEMDYSSIVSRQIASIINRPLDAIQMGLHPTEIARAKVEFKKLNCHIDDRSSLTVEEICYSARMENKRSKTSAIFVDYVQIIKTEKGHNRANEVALISAQLKALAKELTIPVIVASQLNRNNELREIKTPQLSDLKESGALEQDADVVILLYRDKASPQEASVSIAKNRNGPTAELHMEYAPAQTKFIDLGQNDI